MKIPTAHELSQGFRLSSIKKSEPEVDLLVCGDLCPINRTEEAILNKKTDAIWNGIDDTMKNAFLRIVNLECPLTDKINPILKSGPVFSAKPVCAEFIREGGFDIVTLANNHTMDMGQQGLFDTMEACSRAGMRTVGAGSNLEDASQPLIVDGPSIRIAILAFAENEFGIASKNDAGVNPLNVIDNYHQIQRAKEQSDFILIILHGGNELYPLPNPGLVKTCRFYVDCGANAIVCHHTHVASGLEIYKNTPIVYGTGNFLFDWAEKRDKKWYTGYIVSLSVQKGNVAYIRLIPYFQFWDTLGIRCMDQKENNCFLEEIERLSNIINDSQQLRTEWESFCKRNQFDYLSNLFGLNRVERKLCCVYPYFRRKWLNVDRINRALNLIRCESHREILIETLQQRYEDY